MKKERKQKHKICTEQKTAAAVLFFFFLLLTQSVDAVPVDVVLQQLLAGLHVAQPHTQVQRIVAELWVAIVDACKPVAGRKPDIVKSVQPDVLEVPLDVAGSVGYGRVVVQEKLALVQDVLRVGDVLACVGVKSKQRKGGKRNCVRNTGTCWYLPSIVSK
jgi:hypothetical protein